jgi:hypothetical protein
MAVIKNYSKFEVRMVVRFLQAEGVRVKFIAGSLQSKTNSMTLEHPHSPTRKKIQN